MSYSLQPFFNGIAQGRLTLASGTPVTTTDQTAKNTIYFTPYKGNGISLFNGSGWSTIAFSEASVAVPSTLFKCFDVFGFLSSGALAIETLDWSQTTGSITAATNATPVVVTSNSHGLSVGNVVGISGMGTLTSLNGSTWVITAQDANTFTLGTSAGNGVYSGGGTWYKINNSRATALVATTGGAYTKSGDTTRLYLGTGCTTGTSGQTEDSYVLGNNSGGRRLLWNYYNRVSRDAAVTETTANYTYTIGSFRQVNAKGGNKVEIVVGVSEDPVNVTALSLSSNSAAYSAGSGIGMDSVTTNTGTIFSGAGLSGGAGAAPNRSTYIGYPSAGYHTIAWLEITQVAGTTTWYGTQSLYFNVGLKATVLG